MNLMDKAITAVFPGWGVRRLHARAVVNAYEGAKATRFRKKRGDDKSAEVSAGSATADLRKLGRELDENNDIARGILNTLVNSVVGKGIRTEPQIKDLEGNTLVELNRELLELLRDWMRKPEVTGEHHWFGAQRLACRSWFRDGEMFTQKLSGNIRGLDHKTTVPFSIELIESDLVPADLEDIQKKIRYGIRRNAWGQPITFFLYKTHPGDSEFGYSVLKAYKKVPAKQMIHLKYADRIRQGRGISIFASVFNRLDDVRDFEESERLAARIAAAQVMAITKPQDAFGSNTYNTDGTAKPRSFSISPGTVWDNLQPGEEPKILSSERPNNNIETYRNSQLKSAAGGAGAGYSSISKDYNGTYSAQRQELVEQSIHYSVLQDNFIELWCRPIHEDFVKIAVASGKIELPDNVDMNTLYDADFRGPGVPWIDPEKEVNAEIKAINAGIKSRSQSVRERGGNPHDVREQIASEREQDRQLGLDFTEKGKTASEPASPDKKKAGNKNAA